MDFFYQMKHLDYGIVLLSQAMMLGVSMMFVYCYYGEMANDSFQRMADALYESNWLNLPFHLQKYYVLMMPNAQRSLYYHGFHVCDLSLSTFAKVMFKIKSCSTALFQHLFLTVYSLWKQRSLTTCYCRHWLKNSVFDNFIHIGDSIESSLACWYI